MEEIRLPILKLCPAFRRIFRSAAAALGSGDIAAMTIGGVIVKIASDADVVPGSPDEHRLLAHEREHMRQSAGYAPWWARLFPLSIRATLGAPKYIPAYVDIWRRTGYAAHPYEIAARYAAGE